MGLHPVFANLVKQRLLLFTSVINAILNGENHSRLLETGVGTVLKNHFLPLNTSTQNNALHSKNGVVERKQWGRLEGEGKQKDGLYEFH